MNYLHDWYDINGSFVKALLNSNKQATLPSKVEWSAEPDWQAMIVKSASNVELDSSYESDDSVTFFKDIPGVTRDNVTTYIEDDVLVIKTKRTAGLPTGTKPIEHESYFDLPPNLDRSPKVFIADGVLYFTFSKVKLKNRVDLMVE